MPILDFFLINEWLYREILPITNTEGLCPDSQLDQVQSFKVFLIFIFPSLFCWRENSHILAPLRKMCSPLPFDPLSFSRNQRQFRPTSCFHTSLGKNQTLNSQSLQRIWRHVNVYQEMIHTLVRTTCSLSAVSGSGLPASEEDGHSHTTRGRYWFLWQDFGKKHFSTSAFINYFKKSFATCLTQIYQMCDITEHTAESTLICHVIPLNNQSLSLPENSQLPGRNVNVFATAVYRY